MEISPSPQAPVVVPKPIQPVVDTLIPHGKTRLVKITVHTKDIQVENPNGPIDMVEKPHITVKIDFENGAIVHNLQVDGSDGLQVYGITVHGEVIRITPNIVVASGGEGEGEGSPSQIPFTQFNPTPSPLSGKLLLSKMFVILPPVPKKQALIELLVTEANFGKIEEVQLDYEVLTQQGPPGGGGTQKIPSEGNVQEVPSKGGVEQ